jgi:hypothetical protein
MALHKPKQLYVFGKLLFSSIKPMKMIELWLKITIIEEQIVQPWLCLGDVGIWTIFLKLLRVMSNENDWNMIKNHIYIY